jgi:hypothetical protein
MRSDGYAFTGEKCMLDDALKIAAGCIAFCQLLFAEIPITLNGSLPSSVDNSALESFPPVIMQVGESCGNAAGIGHLFNYEMNVTRGTSAKIETNLYPYIYTYAFLNNGDGSSEETPGVYYRHFLAAWKIVGENGIPTVADYGTSTLSSTAWLHGYDNYYRAMCNRVDAIDSLGITGPASLDTMKQWLRDHGNGSPAGGVMLLTGNIYCCAETTVPSSPGMGDSFLKAWGWSTDPVDIRRCRTSPHALVVVGYNDSVRCDFNGDGRFTNGTSVGDWEIGAVKVANSWGTAAWDGGFIWAGYRTLVLPPESGGTLDNHFLYYITVKKNYSPRLALKAGITCAVRNTISLAVGVAPGRDGTEPVKIRRFERQFNYSGGPHPMRGSGASPSIEIGLDISDLIDSLEGSREGTYFLVVSTKDGSVTVDSLSLMDYTGDSLVQTRYSDAGIRIPSGTATVPQVTNLAISTRLNGSAIRTARPLRGGGCSARLLRLRVGSTVITTRQRGSGNIRISLFTMGGRLYTRFMADPASGILSLPGKLPTGIWVLSLGFPDRTEQRFLLHLQR